MSPALLGFDPLRPELSWLVLAAPLVFALGLVALAARRRARERLVAARHQPRFLPRWSVARARARLVCATLAILFLALAALGPVRGYTLREVARRGLDLVVCVDTSRSMLVQDIKPDRLTRAKREVTGLLQRLEDDRAALLAFAGDVRQVAPLTHDRTTLGIFVDTLNTEENLQGGTDIGGVLESALELFDGRTGAHEAVVLITDGEDLEGRGLEVAARAAERGIKVFIVGMATEAGGKIPTERGFVRDETGTEVVSRLDGTSLATLADLTGGAYVSAERSPLPLEELFEKRISKLEGRELFSGKERIPHDRFQWPLVLAAGCMLLELGLRERRGRTRGERRAERRARAGAVARAAAGLAAVCVSLAARGPQTQGPVVPGTPGAPVAQAPSAAEAAAAAEAAVRVAPELWDGDLASGLAEVERRVAAGEIEGALALADGLTAPSLFALWRGGLDQGFARAALDLGTPLWDALGWNGPDERQRAALALTRGLVLAHGLDAADLDEARREAFAGAAERSFQAARADAGPGALRRDAVFDLGTLDLREGERQRALLPEVSGAQAPGAPTMPPGQPGGHAGGHIGPAGAAPEQEPPDPLELAREAYLAARAHFVERLRQGWRDADTQADVELVQRRLRELDEIERAREEQEQEQQEQQQQQQEQEDQQESEDQQDGEPQDENEQEREDEQEGQPEEPEEPQDEEQGEEEPEPEGEPEEDEPSEQDEAQPAEQEPEERLLTKEEVQRLLDRLQQIEDEGERVRQQLMRTRRAKVDKDW